MRNVHMTEGHESQEPPFFLSGKSISHTETVGNDSLDDIVVRQDDSLGITCVVRDGDTQVVKLD